MHPFFLPLNTWEVGLLLTTLTIGGSDKRALLKHLEANTQARLAEKVTGLMGLNQARRIQLMVRELKFALEFGSARGIERMEPSWIVYGLKGESPRVVAIVLLGLPLAVQQSVLKRLPEALRNMLPPKQVIHNLPVALLNTVRTRFEARFYPMEAPHVGAFRFSDIIHLTRIDLYRLIRDLGIIELGQAFAAVGRVALVELCKRLPAEHTEELLDAVLLAANVNLPASSDTEYFLSHVVATFSQVDELLQKSGMWRLAKACAHEDPAYCGALAQRMPYQAAKIFQSYIDAQKADTYEASFVYALHDSILVRMMILSQHGIIAREWADMPIHFYDANTANTWLQAYAHHQQATQEISIDTEQEQDDNNV